MALCINPRNLREQGIQDTLTGQKGVVTNQLLGNRAGRTDGPHVHHGELLLLAVELDLQNLVLQSVTALLGNVGDGSASTRRKGDQMVGDQAVLVDSTISIASSNVVANLEVAIDLKGCQYVVPIPRRNMPLFVTEAPLYLEVLGNKVPGDFLVQSDSGDTTRNVNTVGLVTNGLRKSSKE